jgi:ubiquitin carboxyl-terminal hydrolase 4/11/15
MPSNPVDQYTKLLSREQHENDEYVIIDVKWFEHWKRFVGIDSLPDKIAPPGPIDFTNLIDISTLNHSDGVQLRPDAVEGNDYTFIPYELYQDLVHTYKKIGNEIIRKVIPTGEFQTVIETYLIPLRVRKSRQFTSTTKQIYRSRRTKLEDLKNDISKMFLISPDSSTNYRLHTSTDDSGDNWEPIDARPGAILADIELSKNALITYEPIILTRNNLSPVPTGTFYTPGLCGLSNLGNTCFMNSALQCISNVPSLTDYFLRREYLQHINRDNPLGMKGDVAQAYGDLIANMWSGKISYYAPKALKQNVARYAPQFSGYSQQDSQEFMSFLLDGLHEDLNLIKQKPYMEKKDDDGIAHDVKLASEQWDYYRKRNQSKIHDIFHGQIKSVVQCLECKTLGRTFDPICFLSLPLPNKKKIRIFKIEYIRLNGQIKYYYIKSNERGRMHNLLKDFCERFQPKQKHDIQEPMEADNELTLNTINSNNQDDEQEEDLTAASDYDGHQPKIELILPVEVYNHRIHLQYSDDALLTNILERDQIVFYEVPVSLKKENNDTILMPCLFRTSDSLHQNFGLPIYLNIPRHKCTGKHIQDALLVKNIFSL